MDGSTTTLDHPQEDDDDHSRVECQLGSSAPDKDGPGPHGFARRPPSHQRKREIDHVTSLASKGGGGNCWVICFLFWCDLLAVGNKLQLFWIILCLNYVIIDFISPLAKIGNRSPSSKLTEEVIGRVRPSRRCWVATNYRKLLRGSTSGRRIIDNDNDDDDDPVATSAG